MKDNALRAATYRHRQLLAVKTVHSLIWLGVEAGMAHLRHAGLRRRWDRRTAVAALVVAGESLVFVGNSCRCPLTDLAERQGAVRGSVTDIFLPRSVAEHLPAIHVPFLVLALWLHGAIALERRRTRRSQRGHSGFRRLRLLNGALQGRSAAIVPIAISACR